MPTHLRRIVRNSLAALLLLLVWTLPARPAEALSNSDPLAIISAVNALRATQGLPPYVIDPGLMSYALEHSRYQASLHTATHQHSDGSTVWQNGMDENIAEGMLGYLTPEYAVFTIWSDAIHMKTMIGYATGSVGAGVADDGAKEFYTLDVRPGGSVIPPKNGNPDPNATPTKIIPIVPLLTVTPRGDRWIIHTVGYGQSLWSVAIAYGVKMDQLRDWNSMERDSTAVYAGQKLYIIAPANIWPTLTASPEGGPALADSGQAAPGGSITEDPLAAAQKATYQATVAQDPLASGKAALEVAVKAATASPLPEGQAALSATNSPTSLVNATVIPAGEDAPGQVPQAENLPLVAGVLILFGGGLLVIIAFMML
ncbi:MAG: LysM peptidoglycan-binding domain-containing protein, partial [Anaerolineaceae bacterium]|nr:LysM peptidoglycan-binding domain-containing protein [Anaerolineaceae bacterium]